MVPLTSLEVRNAPLGEFPSPEAFPEQVREKSAFLVQLGVPMKCGLSANATGSASAATTPNRAATTSDRRFRNPLGIAAFLPLVRGRFVPSRVLAGRWAGKEVSLRLSGRHLHPAEPDYSGKRRHLLSEVPVGNRGQRGRARSRPAT